jgi:glycosyltransferase involved in cell wall biosynthesis
LEEVLKNINFEIVVIDDNSPDGTAEIAEEFGKNLGT